MKKNTARIFHVMNRQVFRNSSFLKAYIILILGIAWGQLTEQDKKSCIQQAIDYLENEDKRISSLKSIIFISLGTIYVKLEHVQGN